MLLKKSRFNLISRTVFKGLEKTIKSVDSATFASVFLICTIGVSSAQADHSLAASIEPPQHALDTVKSNSIVISSSVSEGGLQGVCVRAVDLQTGRFREDTTLGINHEAHGFDGHVSWSEDSGQRVRMEGGEFARTEAKNEAYRNCLGYWFPNRFAAEIHFLGRKQTAATTVDTFSVKSAGGRPFELWFDAETRLLVRLIEAGFYTTLSTDYSNFRWVKGVPVPFYKRVSNGEPSFDRIERVQGVQADPTLADDYFMMPKEGEQDFTVGARFPRTIHFRLASNLVIVDAVLNGKTMPFILDTGGINLLFPETVKELNLVSEGRFLRFGGGQNEVTTSRVTVDSLELGCAYFRPQVFSVYPFPVLREATGLPNLAGILGYEIFKRFVIKIDYPQHQITLSLPATFNYSGDGTVVPFHFVENAIEVDGAINSIPSRIIIDTGTTGALILYSPWVNDHRQLFPKAFEKVYTATAAAGGEAQFGFAVLPSVSLANLSFQNVLAALSLQTAGATANRYSDGMVGAELFLKSTVTFDYLRQRMIIESR